MSQYDETTLVVKHLPSELDVPDRIDFLKHLGAYYVKCISSQVKRSSLAFARFHTKEKCQAVLRSLHQKEILGSLLSVEYAKGKSVDFSDVVDSAVKSSDVHVSDETTSQRKVVEAYCKRLNAWTNSTDFSQPPPPHLRYQYPPPSDTVLRNICKVLARVPKFYTQVLHLMNKMNLPCPFSEAFQVESDLVPDDLLEPVKTEVVEKHSESESEMDSGDELRPAFDDVVPVKRKIPFTVKNRAKMPKIVKPKPSRKPNVKPEEVFETTRVQAPKKIELKVSADLNVVLDAPELPKASDSFGILEAKQTESLQDENRNESEDQGKEVTGVISSEELEMNRIPPKDFHLLPVFKNYQPGPPTCRLYIKNLSKSVSSEDLDFIFNRYRVDERGDQMNLFDIRLMQEGRMKGQAFVSLQSVELAEKAVKETNGYILKGKAMVVQFARSNKPK